MLYIPPSCVVEEGNDIRCPTSPRGVEFPLDPPVLWSRWYGTPRSHKCDRVIVQVIVQMKTHEFWRLTRRRLDFSEATRTTICLLDLNGIGLLAEALFAKLLCQVVHGAITYNAYERSHHFTYCGVAGCPRSCEGRKATMTYHRI